MKNTDKQKPKCYLYRCFDERETLLYIGISLNAIHRLAQHTKSADWMASVRQIKIEAFETRAEALLAEKNAIRAERPIHNIQGNKTRQCATINVSGGIESNGEPFLYFSPEIMKLMRGGKKRVFVGRI